jgi:hypothetical protein
VLGGGFITSAVSAAEHAARSQADMVAAGN